MKLTTIMGASVLAAALLTAPASAHRAWIKPSTTVVSGDSEWVSFDAAIANMIFVADHYPMPLERVKAMAADGSEVELQNTQKMKYRSVFDVELTQSGTYKIYSASQSLMARWTDKEGKTSRWPGRGETGDLDGFKKAVPSDAKDLEVTDASRRMEVFVTLGAPSEKVLEPTGKGLELVPVTHPNDLYVNEKATFKFTIDGDAAGATTVTVVREGEKYRDTAQLKEVEADSNGQVVITFDEPGMYWLEAEYKDDKGQEPASTRQGSYVTILEVLPL